MNMQLKKRGTEMEEIPKTFQNWIKKKAGDNLDLIDVTAHYDRTLTVQENKSQFTAQFYELFQQRKGLNLSHEVRAIKEQNEHLRKMHEQLAEERERLEEWNKNLENRAKNLEIDKAERVRNEIKNIEFWKGKLELHFAYRNEFVQNFLNHFTISLNRIKKVVN